MDLGTSVSFTSVYSVFNCFPYPLVFDFTFGDTGGVYGSPWWFTSHTYSSLGPKTAQSVVECACDSIFGINFDNLSLKVCPVDDQYKFHLTKFKKRSGINVSASGGCTGAVISRTYTVDRAGTGVLNPTIASDFISAVHAKWKGVNVANTCQAIFSIDFQLNYTGTVLNPDIDLYYWPNEDDPPLTPEGQQICGTTAPPGAPKPVRVDIWLQCAGPGAKAHEFGHVLGFADAYDLTTGAPLPGHIFDIMSSNTSTGLVLGYHGRVLTDKF